MTWSSMMMLPALGLVLGLVWLAGRAARSGWLRLPAASVPNGRLALVQSLAIDPRRRVLLIRCDGRHVLLLTGGTQDTLLGWLADEPGP